jgi:phage major head subunit gpT-like protein
VAIVRNNVLDLLEEKFRNIFFLSYDDKPEQYRNCFNVLTSVKNNEHMSGVSGLAMPGTKAEGSDMVYDDPEQLWDSTATHTTFAQGGRVTMEAMDDDQYGILGSRMFGSMGRGFRQRVDTNAANVFNDGFSGGTSVTSADGVDVFSASHTRNPNDATTHANTPSTQADLSVSSLKAAIQNFEQTLDHRGLLLNIKPKTLLVPNELRFTAEEILQSQLEPHVAENTTNVLRGEGLAVSVNDYLTDADAWFLMADKSDHQFYFYWRKQPTFKRDSDFDSWDAKFGGVMRFSTLVQDWRGSYGTSGA